MSKYYRCKISEKRLTLIKYLNKQMHMEKKKKLKVK